VNSRRSALLISTDHYLDGRLAGLPSASADVDRLEQVLADPAIGGYRVRRVNNEPAHQVSLALEDFFVEAGFDSLLLLYISGHGIKDDGGRLFFANTRH
jgi:hypothetical protein